MIKSPGGVLLPPNVQSVEPRPFICRVPSCRAALTGREYERHVVECSKRHEDELRDLSVRERVPWLTGPLDPELDEWIRDNRDAVVEGRKRFGTSS